MTVPVLKRAHQPDKKLRQFSRSGTLRKHALAVLAEVYQDGVRQAVAETEVPVSNFPTACPYTLEQLLDEALLEP